jgi:RNA polymerase sigma factor (TIGR02999 family)
MLVNEAFIKLFGGASVDWSNRQHFINTAARAMGHFLIDRARARDSAKRGGGRKAIPLTIAAGELADYHTAHSMPAAQAIDALTALEGEAADAAEVARFRFVLGFSVEETAEITGMAPRTVKKKWAFGKAWMRKYLSEHEDETTDDPA